MKKVTLYISLICCLLSSCDTIIEDRKDCPCRLSLDFSSVEQTVDEVHIWYFGSDGNLLKRDTVTNDRYDSGYVAEIKRDMVTYYVWGGVGKATDFTDNVTPNSSLVKRADVSADSLFVYSRTLSTVSEAVSDTVILDKEFATVAVTISSVPQGGDSIYMDLYTTTLGQYIDRRLIAGAGRTRVRPVYTAEGKSVFTCRMLRQNETYLPDVTITLMTVHEQREQVMAQLPFGKWLLESGYEMNGRSLKDIEMEIDISMNYITVNIDDWQTTIPANIQI